MKLNNQLFQKGEVVPTWLLDCEPKTAGASRPLLVFNRTTLVVELAEYYWLLPYEIRESAIMNNVNPITIKEFKINSKNIRLLAPTKTILWPSKRFYIRAEFTEEGQR